MRVYTFPIIFLLAAGMAGCNGNTATTTIFTITGTSISADSRDGSIALHVPGREDAKITATGDLRIAGTSVMATPAQRDLLKRYHTTALLLREHGVATGNAGIATADKAVSSVMSGLASGNTDNIDREVNASAAKVEAQATLVCNDLAELQSTQNTLATELPAFQPYAMIKGHEAGACKQEVDYRN
ncbi:MAG: hypothetical protein ABIU96_14950 [Rhodanobacter sp.]